MKFLKQTIATHQEIYVADITVEQGLITKIVRLKSTPNFNNVLLPGYIDVHTHGGYGFDFNDLKNSDYHLNLQKYINKIHSEGVTSVMATTVTCPMNDLNNIGKNIMNIQSHDVNNVIVGWNMEGPFIAPDKKGAHDKNYIIPINDDLLRLIKRTQEINISVVVAPEYKNNIKKIPQIMKYANVAIGHSLSSANLAIKAIDHGANKIIHLYNAMSGFDHHNPGIVNAAFLDKRVFCELICDNIHVDPITIKNSFDILTPKRIVIISDSLNCKGLKNGNYMLGTLPIIKHDNIANLSGSATIAGSVTPYDTNVRNMFLTTKCSLSDIVQMSSYNAAKSIHQEDHLGVIAVGAKANFVVVDRKLNVLKTYVNGKRLFKR